MRRIATMALLVSALGTGCSLEPSGEFLAEDASVGAAEDTFVQPSPQCDARRAELVGSWSVTGSEEFAPIVGLSFSADGWAEVVEQNFDGDRFYDGGDWSLDVGCDELTIVHGPGVFVHWTVEYVAGDELIVSRSSSYLMEAERTYLEKVSDEPEFLGQPWDYPPPPDAGVPRDTGGTDAGGGAGTFHCMSSDRASCVSIFLDGDAAIASYQSACTDGSDGDSGTFGSGSCSRDVSHVATCSGAEVTLETGDRAQVDVRWYPEICSQPVSLPQTCAALGGRYTRAQCECDFAEC